MPSRHLLLPPAVAWSLAALVGCSSSSSTTGSADGSANPTDAPTVDGHPFTAASAAMGLELATCNGLPPLADGGPCPEQRLDVVLTNSPSVTCSMATAGAPLAGVEVLTLRVQSSAAELVPGTYGVSTVVEAGAKAPIVTASLSVYGATCELADLASARTGTITVSAVSATTATGTYDLTFPLGHLTGTFDAKGCPAADGGKDAGTRDASPACITP